MSIIRSERYAAGLLLAAAVLGLVLANTAIGPGLLALKDAHLDIPFLALDLSIGHWISDGLLAIFFFIVAVELKHELVAGELNSPGKALLPAFAALGGVIVPAGIFLAFTVNTPYLGGWPIPTATDIAFALGVLAVFGKNLPGQVRIFLLALAILDDLIAILIIAVFFTQDSNILFLGAAAIAVALFGLLGRKTSRGPAILAIMVVVAVIAWYLVYRSGVHATIAGVALGLALSRRPASRVVHTLEPFSNGVVLPLFAFSAAAVAIPALGITDLAAPFWGILVALPVGKILGITAFGLIGAAVAKRRGGQSLDIGDMLTVGALGGIGFTVSLLMNELAFARSEEIVDEGTLAVLLGSGISMVLSAVLVTLRSRHYGRRAVNRKIRRAAR